MAEFSFRELPISLPRGFSLFEKSTIKEVAGCSDVVAALMMPPHKSASLLL